MVREARDFALTRGGAVGGGDLIVEVFVGGVEGGDGDVDDFHFADGAVAAAGFDEDAGHGLDGEEFTIELDVALTFEDEIDLGHLFVIVAAGFFGDVDHVDAGDGVFGDAEGAPRGAAGAGGAGDFVELFDEIVFHGRDIGGGK